MVMHEADDTHRRLHQLHVQALPQTASLQAHRLLETEREGSRRTGLVDDN